MRPMAAALPSAPGAGSICAKNGVGAHAQAEERQPEDRRALEGDVVLPQRVGRRSCSPRCGGCRRSRRPDRTTPSQVEAVAPCGHRRRHLSTGSGRPAPTALAGDVELAERPAPPGGRSTSWMNGADGRGGRGASRPRAARRGEALLDRHRQRRGRLRVDASPRAPRGQRRRRCDVRGTTCLHEVVGDHRRVCRCRSRAHDGELSGIEHYWPRRSARMARDRARVVGRNIIVSYFAPHGRRARTARRAPRAEPVRSYTQPGPTSPPYPGPTRPQGELAQRALRRARASALALAAWSTSRSPGPSRSAASWCCASGAPRAGRRRWSCAPTACS